MYKQGFEKLWYDVGVIESAPFGHGFVPDLETPDSGHRHPTAPFYFIFVYVKTKIKNHICILLPLYTAVKPRAMHAKVTVFFFDRKNPHDIASGALVLHPFITSTPMDDSVHPPVRLQAISSTTLSTKTVKGRVDDFLADFQNRSTPAKGGDTTVTAQLQKLSGALQEKLDRRKTADLASWYVAGLNKTFDGT